LNFGLCWSNIEPTSCDDQIRIYQISPKEAITSKLSVTANSSEGTAQQLSLILTKKNTGGMNAILEQQAKKEAHRNNKLFKEIKSVPLNDKP
jgi:hypothetical protein